MEHVYREGVPQESENQGGVGQMGLRIISILGLRIIRVYGLRIISI